jgi:hypothetical protein
MTREQKTEYIFNFISTLDLLECEKLKDKFYKINYCGEKKVIEYRYNIIISILNNVDLQQYSYHIL